MAILYNAMVRRTKIKPKIKSTGGVFGTLQKYTTPKRHRSAKSARIPGSFRTEIIC